MSGSMFMAPDSSVDPDGVCSVLQTAIHELSSDGAAAGRILAAARVGWAFLYGEVLLSGNIPDGRLRRFDDLLGVAIEQLNKHQGQPLGISKDVLRDRLIFYRKLLHLLQTEGLNRVAEEIERNFGKAPH